MSAIRNRNFTEDEYLAAERKAEYKSQFYKGEIFAMAGATFQHTLIVSNLLSVLNQKLKGTNCKPVGNDLRVHSPLNSLYTYPDILIVCGKKEFLDNSFDTLLNPSFIAEVLSPSTANFDRSEKFTLYRAIPSLKEYWTISSFDCPLIEKYVKAEDGNTWIFSEMRQQSGTYSLDSLNVQLSLEDIYDGVDF
jgi:Uma2 family endonuclease